MDLGQARGRARSRRNSSMRARIIGKSSAARGRVTFPPFSCNSDVITRPRRSARSGPGHCFRRRRPAGSPVSISFFRKGRGRAEPRAGPHPSALYQAKPARSQVSARVRLPAQRFVPDSPLEGDGFELSVHRVMGGRFRTTVPAAIAVFEVAGVAAARRWLADRHPEFRDETYDGQLLGLWTAIVLIGEVRESKIPRFRPKS
jgi:hypothetical protein